MQKEIQLSYKSSIKQSWKAICTVVLLVLNSINGFAQKQDTAVAILHADLNLDRKVTPIKFKPAHLIAPVILMGYGFAAVYNHGALRELDVSTKDELQEDHPQFAAHVDDYIQFAPAIAVVGLNIAGIKGKHNLFDASMFYVTSAGIMGLSTHFVKRGVHRLRPDDSGQNSFPSGHTASAFAAAEFLHQEYKDVSPWYGYGGYLVATATGTLRMYNNKHWFSDVVAGAGFGIASTKISYLVYPYIKRIFIGKAAQNLSVLPARQDGANGFAASYRF